MTAHFKSLDLGVGRYLEHTLDVFVGNRIPEDELEAAATEFLAKNPLLRSRLSLTRRRARSVTRSTQASLIRVKTLYEPLGDYLDIHQSSVSTISTQHVGRLKELFEFEPTGGDLFKPHAFSIRALVFKDATVLQFICQHPMADINTLFRGARDFCIALQASLNENDGERRVAYKTVPAAFDAAEIQAIPKWGMLSEMHAKYSRRGFYGLASSIASQLWHKRAQRPRSERLAFIPPAMIKSWTALAEQARSRVTPHDLLLAWLRESNADYWTQLGRPKSSSRAPFAFTATLTKQLQPLPATANPWVLLPIDHDAPGDRMIAPKYDRLVHSARQIRSIILDSRNPAFVSAMLDQHSTALTAPFGPRHHGWSGPPHVIVTSWAQQPWFDVKIPTGGEKALRQPSFVSGSVATYPLMRAMGVEVNDLLCVWKGQHGGYWIRGNLEDGLWEKIVDQSGRVVD